MQIHYNWHSNIQASDANMCIKQYGLWDICIVGQNVPLEMELWSGCMREDNRTHECWGANNSEL